MRDLGSFEKRSTPPDALGDRLRPKPDFLSVALNAQELHAYYIAVLSCQGLAVLGNGSLITRRFAA